MDTSSDILGSNNDGATAAAPSSSHTVIMHDRSNLAAYLSDDNHRELVACGFKGHDIAKCWATYFSKRAIKGKCQACGMAVRIPMYLAKILKVRYHKDPDRPHAIFIYSQTVVDMEKINPQRVHTRSRRRHPEEEEEDARQMPSQSCKLAAMMSSDANLELQMEALGAEWEKAQSIKRASMLIPVCFECYLGAKSVTDPLGYRITSVYNIPNLETKRRSPAHGQFDKLDKVNQNMVLLDQLRQRVAWCSLPGSRHCIHVSDNGVGGFKVCAKRRPPIYRDHLHEGRPTYNDYCCLEHRSGPESSAILPPVEYIGLFASRAVF